MLSYKCLMLSDIRCVYCVMVRQLIFAALMSYRFFLVNVQSKCVFAFQLYDFCDINTGTDRSRTRQSPLFLTREKKFSLSERKVQYEIPPKVKL